MIIATVYNTESGRIVAIITGSPEMIALNVGPGEAVIEGEYDPATTRFIDGAPAPLPGPTTAELAAALSARRAATVLDKSDLLIRLAIAGILSPAEAEGAASGTIPASMASMMAALPPEAQMAARIKWAGDTQISRTHPVIVTAAYALGISDEALDQIFGVTP